MSLLRTQLVSINTFSDGDSNHLPKTTAYWKEDPPILYLEKLATLWMQHRGESVRGKRYMLNRLPDGYSLWAKRRNNQEKVIDKWLFGHPNHKWVDSPNRFFPHFLHLMEHGTNVGCPCTVCTIKGARIPNIGENRLPRVPIVGPKSRGRPRVHEPPSQLDSEGTPDIYRTLINRLEQDRYVDVPIEEHMSLDWRVEHEHLRQMLDSMPIQPSWIPRLGELVLFLRTVNESGLAPSRTGAFETFNAVNQQWETFPPWEAGVVTQVAQEDLRIEELIEQPKKDYQVNYAGFRIEPISDPNSKSKPFSRRYKYVPLNHIRPFTFWAEVLHGIPLKEIHETIEYAKTLASSLTLIGKYRFRGIWPSSDIFCRGIYVGPELIVVGDTVRLLPTLSTGKVTDILKMTAIKLQFSNLAQASRDDQSDGHPYNSTIVIVGKAYTTDIRKAVPGAQPVRPNIGLIPADIHNYGKFYPMHAAGQSMQIPFRRILGRCYANKAMYLWFSSTESDTSDAVIQSVGLSSGLQGTLEAREYARKRDKRISREGRNWLWTDTRAEALDVESVNGIETAKYDETRDPRKWVRYIKELDGTADPEDKAALIKATEKSRRSFGGLTSQSTFVQSALGPTSETSPDIDDQDEEEEDDMERASKRSRSVIVESRERSTEAGKFRQDADVNESFMGEASPPDTAEDMIGIEDDGRRLAQVDVDDSNDSDDDDDVIMLDKFQSRQ